MLPLKPPYYIRSGSRVGQYNIICANETLVAAQVDKATAEFIVMACNHFDNLEKAAVMLSDISNGRWAKVSVIDDLLAKIRGDV